MRNKPAPMPAPSGADWKALGYLISMVSVFFLGAIAWPKPGDPAWHLPVLIVGMACRYQSHLDQKRELRKAEAEARRS